MQKKFYADRQLADAATERLKVFAQPQRLMILSALLENELSVGDIEKVTGIGQPSLSQQLAILRRAGVVQTRREGTLVFYDLADDHMRLCIGCMQAMLGGSDNPLSSLEDVIEKAA